MSRFKVIIIILLLTIFLLVNYAIYFFNRELNRQNEVLTENLIVEIKEDESASEIADYLLDLKAISNKQVFLVALRILRRSLKPGFYELTPKITTKEIIDKIHLKQTKVVKLTFPEGWRNEQIALRLDANGVVPYQEFLAEADGLSGKLFPDTYFFNPKMTAKDVVDKMLANYKSRIASLGKEVSNNTLILASIIEREALNDDERPLIAGVYLNRLDRGMRLGSDPTVQYGKDNISISKITEEEKKGFSYWQKITLSDYQNVRSEYNTYLIPALPPTPICNPGLKSIEAAINPESHNYLYFLHNDGQIYPSRTLNEHNQKRRDLLGSSL